MVLGFNLQELIIFVISLVTFCLVMFDAIRLRVKAKKFQAMHVQAEVNNLILTAQLDSLSANRDATNIEQSEGFLKFVSESRDWAFEYIENVQKAIMEYDLSLNKDDAVVRNEAYKKLVSFLPEDK